MKSNQGSFMKRAVLAGLIAGGGVLAVSAYAMSNDAAATPRCEAHGQKGDGGWAAKRAEHLATLKEKLKLAPNQEAAWDAFSAASQRGSREPGTGREAMREDFAKLSTPERLDRMQAHAETRRAHMATRVEAIKALYAQLTPEQQKVFDAEAMPNRHGRHHGHHRHHG
jgi:Spy/CpxP family protein refolding chaperone